MQKLNRNRVGLALGSFMGLFHLGWAILIWLNWAKPFTDFVLDLHHLNIQYSLGNLDTSKAVLLVIFTFVAGYVMGWVFSAIWNAFRK